MTKKTLSEPYWAINQYGLLKTVQSIKLCEKYTLLFAARGRSIRTKKR